MSVRPSAPFRGSLLVLAFGVVACGGSGRPSSGADAVQCGDESRPQLDCSSEVRYDSASVQGKFEALGLGSVSGEMEQKALRQIDEQSAQYIAQARRLCDEYNKCVLDRDTYATRSENLRRRLAKVPELYERVRGATDEGARRAAVAEAYRELVPEEARVELGLSFSVLAQKPGEASATVVEAGATLPTETRVAFLLEVTHPAHAYLFQWTEARGLNVLYPDPRIKVRSPIPAASALRIPQEGANFRLDERDVGTERVFIVVSLEPIPALSEAAAALLAGATEAPALERMKRMSDGCRSRALTFEAGTSAQGCFRSRGLVLESGAAGAVKSSVQATTEAADTMIARVFSFEHVP